MVDPVAEKRMHERKDLGSLVGVVFSFLGKEEKYLGLIDNVSRDGLGITSEIQVPSGTLLELVVTRDDQEESWAAKERCFWAEVRWCAPGVGELDVFHLGVKAIKGPDDGP